MKLKSSMREHLPSGVFGMPSERKYPMPDKAHAINAKARATQMHNAGKLSMVNMMMIDKKANKVIKDK